jgi:alkanesulfonate monooxygenase SsuD/methylene tetrahydromethanopterin reductase-like flavin-dependent oxidoreductase (luciferase family)
MRIWIGANKPRMLRLTGRFADGLIISSPYVPPEKVPEINALIDEGARQAGRDPLEIRRGYNLVGVITTVDGMQARPARPGVIVGPVDMWVDTLVGFYRDLRMDTFNFGFGGGDAPAQSHIFIEEVVPRVREALSAT